MRKKTRKIGNPDPGPHRKMTRTRTKTRMRARHRKHDQSPVPGRGVNREGDNLVVAGAEEADFEVAVAVITIDIIVDDRGLRPLDVMVVDGLHPEAVDAGGEEDDRDPIPDVGGDADHGGNPIEPRVGVDPVGGVGARARTQRIRKQRQRPNHELVQVVLMKNRGGP